MWKRGGSNLLGGRSLLLGKERGGECEGRRGRSPLSQAFKPSIPAFVDVFSNLLIFSFLCFIVQFLFFFKKFHFQCFHFLFVIFHFSFHVFLFQKKKKRVVLTFLSQLLSLIFFCVFGPCREVREERRWGLTLHAGSEKKRFSEAKRFPNQTSVGPFFSSVFSLPFSCSFFTVVLPFCFWPFFLHFYFFTMFCFVLFWFSFIFFSLVHFSFSFSF